MYTFSVEVRGEGFLFAGADGCPLRAFTVTRIVVAADEGEAKSAALTRVAEEWHKGEFASTGVKPQIEAGAVTRLEGKAERQARDAGYFFHPGRPAPQPETSREAESARRLK